MKSAYAAVVLAANEKMTEIQTIMNKEPVDIDALRKPVDELDGLLKALERQAGQEMER